MRRFLDLLRALGCMAVLATCSSKNSPLAAPGASPNGAEPGSPAANAAPSSDAGGASSGGADSGGGAASHVTPDGGSSRGGNTIGGSGATTTIAFPQSFAIVSPFGQSSQALRLVTKPGFQNTAASLPVRPTLFPADPPDGGAVDGGAVDGGAVDAGGGGGGGGSQAITWTPVSPGSAPDAINTQLARVLSPTGASDCQVQLFSENAVVPSCFSPSLGYQDHPDGDCRTTHETFPGSGVQQCQFGSGDLGIWIETDTESGTACSAATFNSNVELVAARVNSAVLVGASTACLATVAGIDIGTSTNMAAALGTSLAVLNPDVTVSSATISITTNDAGASVHTYTFALAATSATLSATMTFVPTATDYSTYYGTLTGRIDPLVESDSVSSVVFSVDFQAPTATDLRYDMLAANFATDDPDTLDDAGHVNNQGDWLASMTDTKIQIDPTTGLGKGAYLWQAGRNDANSRVFNVFTQASGGTTGCGFFGYGEPFGEATLPSTGITTFICNWNGPDPDVDDNPNRSQKQCMSQSISGGETTWVVTSSNITYSPELNCLSPDPTFIGGTFGANPSTWTSFPTTQNLVNLTTDSDYATYGAGPASPVQE